MPSKNYQTPIESSNTFILKVEALVREAITQSHVPYYRIESGLDQHLRFEGQEMYLPAIRIVTYFEDTVGKISEILQDEFDVVLERSVDKKKNKADTFSYKHVNYVASLKANRLELTEYKRYGDKKFEIQICSLLHDAWTGIKKELGYDSETFTEEAKRDISRVGALLEMADMEFLKIKNQLTQKNTEEKNSSPIQQPEVAVTNPPVEVPVAEVTPQPVIVPIQTPEPVAQQMPEPTPAPEAPVAHSDNIGKANVTAKGTIENLQEATARHAPPAFEDRVAKEEPKPGKPILLDENAQKTDATLKEYVLKSKLLKEIDAAIAERAGAKINPEIDIEGDVERLRFLKVHTLKQLHDRLSDNKDEIVAFAEKWIGKDNGGTFDSGISLFYLEYLLVGKKNDPAFAVEYVVKFISDNDYSARYIIPTYNSIRNMDANYSHATLKA